MDGHDNEAEQVTGSRRRVRCRRVRIVWMLAIDEETREHGIRVRFPSTRRFGLTETSWLFIAAKRGRGWSWDNHRPATNWVSWSPRTFVMYIRVYLRYNLSLNVALSFYLEFDLSKKSGLSPTVSAVVESYISYFRCWYVVLLVVYVPIVFTFGENVPSAWK